jgi:hypothetical protein
MIDQVLSHLDINALPLYWEAQEDLGTWKYLEIFDHWQMENGKMEWPDA